MRHYLDTERENIVRDYTEDPVFKMAYMQFVGAFMRYRAGLREYPMAERKHMCEVYRMISGGKEYPE